MELSTRIKEFIDFKGLSVRAFEQKIGASNGLIGNSLKKKTDIQSKWLSKIIEMFPDLNAYWLLAGKGDMIKTIQLEKNQGGAKPEPKAYKLLEQQLAEKDKQIAALLELLNKK